MHLAWDWGQGQVCRDLAGDAWEIAFSDKHTDDIKEY